jgi:hypothetical protein
MHACMHLFDRGRGLFIVPAHRIWDDPNSSIARSVLLFLRVIVLSRFYNVTVGVYPSAVRQIMQRRSTDSGPF